MSYVLQMGYMGVEASDLDAWEHFAVDLLGLQLGHKEPGRSLAFRMDERVQRLIVEQGPADDIAFFGFECESEAKLNALVEHLRQSGDSIEEASPEQAARRCVDRLFITRDPEGTQVEFYIAPAVTDEPFRSKVLRSSFVTGEQGVGHCFMLAGENVQRTLDYYIGLLGFKLTDNIRQELRPGLYFDAKFLHCNNRHHTIGVAAMPSPKRAHHIMFQVESMDDVGYAYDRCLDGNASIEMTPGMHPNDRMYSFYVNTPSGFAVEFGWGGLEIDKETWSAKSFDCLSNWGHRQTQPKVVGH